MDNIILFQPRHFDTVYAVRTGAMALAHERGFVLQTMKLNMRPRDLSHTLQNWKPKGCIIDCSDAAAKASPRVFTAPLEAFNEIPHICLNPPDHIGGAHHAFNHANDQIAARAVAELLQKDLAAYGYVPCEESFLYSVERGRHFAAGLRRHGKSAVAYRPGSCTLDEWLLRMPLPCGLFAANDEVAQNVIVAASRVGLEVPDDVSVIGVDNNELYCEGTIPGITSIETDNERAGRRLAELLFALIADPRRPAIREVYGPSRIVRRGSTASLHTYNPRIHRALEFLRRNVGWGPIRIEDVAKTMRCSYRHASQEFKKVTGNTIIQEIHAIRHRRICELLATSRKSISEIILSVGYESQSFAKHEFRLRTGLTMREYRRRQQTRHDGWGTSSTSTLSR